MNRKRHLSVGLLFILLADPALANTQPESQGPDPLLRDIGQEIGSDRPELKDDARDFRNFAGVTATAVEEFAGVDTKKVLKFTDIFLGLFRKKKNKSGDILKGQEGQDTLAQGRIDRLLESSDEIVGQAGIIDPGLAQAAAGSADFSGSGGGPLGFNPVLLKDSLTSSDLLALQREQLNMQLGPEGQALIAAREEEGIKAMEAVNTVADEIQGVKATQDGIKLASKQRSLQAVISQITASEQQQTRIAQLQGNQTAYRVQEIMEAQEFRRDTNKLVLQNSSFRAATLFSATYGSQGGF